MRSASARGASGLAVTAWAILLAPTPASAKVICATSSNEIVVAFATAPFISDPDVRIVSGTYSFSESLGLKTDSFRVSGGWNSDCTSQTPNGLTTVLQAHANTPIGVSFDSHGYSEVDTLTFRDFGQGVVVHLTPNPWGCCGTPSVGTQFKLRSSAFIGVGSVRLETEGAPDCEHGTIVYFRDNLVALSTDPVIATEITNCAGHNVEVVHNTFVANPNRALALFGVSYPVVLNNAFAGNDRNFTWNYFPEPASPEYCGNVGEGFTSAETHQGHTVDCPGQKNLAADPQLDALTFQPLPGSPAIDFGVTPEEFGDDFSPAVFPDRDLHGNLRFSGLRPDAGVFETAGRCGR